MKYRKYKLGELTEYIKGFAFKSKDFRSNGIPIIKVGNLNSGLEKAGEWFYIDEKERNNYLKYAVRENDAIISTVGSWPTNPASVVGKCCIITKKNENNFLNQNAVIVRSKCKTLEQKYLNYILKSKKFKDYIIGCAQGSASQASITLEDIKRFEIDLPEIETQKNVSSFLHNIDKKIELNNQINDNLSELALTLFKEFIEQNKDSSEKKDLKDCVVKIGTGADAIQRAPIVDYDTGIRCIRVGDMTNNRKYYEWGFTEMTDKDFENYKLDFGDIVVTRTAVNGITKIIDDNEKIVCNNGLIRLKVNNKYNPIYIYMCTKTKDFYDYIHRIDSETSVRPNMKVDYFTSYQIDKISLEKQNEFCNKIDPMLKLQKELEQEIHNLEQLRNTLLPKLINGEIDLENIKI